MTDAGPVVIDRAVAHQGNPRADVAQTIVIATEGLYQRGVSDLAARVVELVALGLPNAAIAKRLFVSLATVKTHLVHVYAKLGIETRAELAAQATAQRFSGAVPAK